MSQILEDLLWGAAGYLVGKKNISKEDAQQIINSYLAAVRPDDLIQDYARVHDVYFRNQEFYEALRHAIENYEDPYAIPGSSY